VQTSRVTPLGASSACTAISPQISDIKWPTGEYGLWIPTCCTTLYIYDNLRNALLDKSSRPPSPSAEIEEGQTAESSAEEQPKRRNPQEAMREVLDRSAETALKLYERETYDPLGSGSTGWKALARKWLPKGAVEEMPGMILRRLHAWRDKVAREEDEGPL
jgi:exosome complex exonuclease RRP6